MGKGLPLLRSVADTLDSLGLAVCVFDDADNTLLWNRQFLKFFPEHAAHIYVGEPYRANLRRFYQGRLAADEMAKIDQYIDSGIARHRNQQRPYAFEHLGVRLWVSSLPLPGIGRIRIWQAHTSATDPQGPTILATTAIDGTALFDHVPDGVMVTGADDRILWANGPFVQMYGLPNRTAAIGAHLEWAYRTAWQGLESQSPELFEAGLLTLSEHTRFTGAPFELPLPGARWSRVIGQRSPDGKGFSAHVDITVLKRQQQQLLEAERRARESEAILQEKSALLEATLTYMEQGVMMVNADRVVVLCNRRARELLNLPQSLMDSRPTLDALTDYQLAAGELVHVPEEVLTSVRTGDIFDRPYAYDRKRRDGRVVEIHSMPIAGGGVLRTYTDITERRHAEERIRHVARHDGLTALVNREVFLESLATACAAEPGSAGFAVHFIDIDRFKPINDNYGHAIGDKVLALIADRMRIVARDGDVVARMGGDEFAVLQCRVEQTEQALGLAHRLLEDIARDMEIESHRLQVGASIGVALYPSAGLDADTLLRNADAAMYAAKAHGRDCVRVFGAHDNPASVY
ncbi:GGDEF domain-containing protein [Rhodoferax sp.]|uniref:diguanylate cyclase domain-containing protein n=1 Tax=Rhodoferax sp. TaxID=50421 RepID=UPI0025FBABD5|nr:GGDEF domain-containing protein [Rhodoferax sp.]